MDALLSQLSESGIQLEISKIHKTVLAGFYMVLLLHGIPMLLVGLETDFFFFYQLIQNNLCFFFFFKDGGCEQNSLI